MEIKIKLLELHKKQNDLVEELRKRGFPKMIPPTLSYIIHGRLNTPQAYDVRQEIYKILAEWEEEQKCQK